MQKKIHWLWGEEQRQAFQQGKQALTSAKIMTPARNSFCLVMLLHNYGVGAVLSHKLEDGTEHPVAFAS